MANSVTYKASEYINNQEFRRRWLDAKSNNRIKVIIDGIEIPSYSDYTYVDTKSYFKEPERSAKGVINNLNSYATFLTPKLKFSFNSMPISAYRTLMKLIKERNEFIVQVYDPVEDEVVVRKMYFSPKDYPQIYTHGYEALRINNEEFELIGTNADLNLYSLVYDSNVTSTSNIRFTTTMKSVATDGDAIVIDGNTYYYSSTENQGYFTGNTIEEQILSLSKIISSTKYTISIGYTTIELNDGTVNTIGNRLEFIPKNYNTTKPIITTIKGTNGTIEFSDVIQLSGGGTSNITTGLTFFYGQEITIGDYDTDVGIDPTTFENAGFTFDKWNTERDGSGVTYLTGQSGIQFTTNITLYAIWKSNTKYTVSFNYQATNYVGETTATKEVIQGETYGTLPDVQYKQGYIFGGWFTQMNGEGTRITADTLFDKTYNETLYAYWIGVENTISFDNHGGNGSIGSITARTGERVILPTNSNNEIYKDGYQNIYWAIRTETTENDITTYTYNKYADLGATITCPDSNLTLYAYWQQRFTVTYYVNDEDSNIKKSYVAIEQLPPSVSRIGYNFIGWFTDYALTKYAEFPLTVTENINLYAKWEKIKTGEQA